MENRKNLTLNDVLGMAEDFPVKPLGHRVVISINMDSVEDTEFETTQEAFSEIQYVLAVGNFVNEQVKPGKKILLDMMSLMDSNGQMKIEPIRIGEYTFTMVSDRNIKAIDNR